MLAHHLRASLIAINFETGGEHNEFKRHALAMHNVLHQSPMIIQIDAHPCFKETILSTLLLNES